MRYTFDKNVYIHDYKEHLRDRKQWGLLREKPEK